MRDVRMTRLHRRRRQLLSLLSPLLLPLAGSAACFSTPQAAVRGAASEAAPPSGTEGTYKLVRIEQDRLLQARWAVVARCDHPEWSTQAIPVPTSSSPTSPQYPQSAAQSAILVHAGATVHLWRKEAMLQIEVSAVAEENAGLGMPVRVRLVAHDENGPRVPEEYIALVRSTSDVEMRP